MKPKLLFICKKRSTEYGELKSSGLLNSARMVVQALTHHDLVDAKLVDVIDGNCIDREVHHYRPTHVILEAFWCPPYKLLELVKLYPKIKWTVRNHSKMSFLSGEGQALGWAFDYQAAGKNYVLSSNSHEAVRDFESVKIPCRYTPNIYYPNPGLLKHTIPVTRNARHINIGCFGAIRQLKNHLIQAMAAIRYADHLGVKLRFHVNIERIEMANSNAVLKNLRQTFAATKHELVEHPWYDRTEWLEVAKDMDLGMQVTLTETFNIVSADMILVHVPIVVSPEINWAPEYTKADPHHIDSIYNTMHKVLSMSRQTVVNQAANNLKDYNHFAIKAWKKFLHL